MIDTLRILARGMVADNAQAVHDANAVAVLRQQVRDAATALHEAKRNLAVTMAYHAAEGRALDALTKRTGDLTASATRALADGRDDLAQEAAVLIAALEDEAADRRVALDRFTTDTDRLLALVRDGEVRLRDLDRGHRTARTAEAVRRAGAAGRRTLAVSSGSLAQAERTLARIQELARSDDDVEAAFVVIDNPSAGIEGRLDASGYGGRRRTDPRDVMARLAKAT